MASSNFSTTEGRRLHSAVAYGKWMLRTCSKHHQLCKSRNFKSNNLPTRLIDVGDSDRFREPFIFITGTPNDPARKPKDTQTLSVIDSGMKKILTWTPFAPAIDIKEEMRYVALSYCWGETQTFTTTTANLANMKERIPWDKLPQTIRDAITITRALGIQYLWIDALCIIQDSQEDWEAESAKMMDVYGGALLTISAAVGPDVHYGLFQERNSLNTDTSPRFTLQNDPLYSRAWALQERILSPRLLIFGSERLSWECDESRPRDQRGRKIPPVLCYRLSPTPSIQDWHRIVQDYCCRNMTNEMDKLPALSGLASVYHQGTQKDYLAGLWRQSLIYDLLWRQQHVIYGNKVKSGVPSKYRAPSWSWASIDGNIWYGVAAEASPITEVLGTFADAPDPTVSNREGEEWISLRGPLFEGSITKGKIDIIPRGTAIAWMDQRELNQALIDWMPTDKIAGWNDTYSMSNLWFLLLAHEMDEGTGLVLTKVKGLSDKRYQRVGYFNCGKDISLENYEKSSIFIV